MANISKESDKGSASWYITVDKHIRDCGKMITGMVMDTKNL